MEEILLSQNMHSQLAASFTKDELPVNLHCSVEPACKWGEQ